MQTKKDEWKVVGWLNMNKKGTAIVVSDGKGNLFGTISIGSLNRFLKGEIKATPIKVPPRLK